jgi:hypothetical protein
MSIKTGLELEEVLRNYVPQLNQLTEDKSSSKPLPTKWSKKEILGHLIDSAQNNLRRFIVAQYEENPKITYRQDFWVKSVNYQEWKLNDLVPLWYLTNMQIVRVLKAITDEAAARTCETESSRTIAWLAEDYLKHLKHHIHQVLDLEEVAYL